MAWQNVKSRLSVTRMESIDHRNQEVKGAVRVRHNEEQRRFLIAQRVQLQFIVHGKVPQLLDVEGG